MAVDPSSIASNRAVTPFNQERLADLAAKGSKLNEQIRDNATEPHRRKILRTFPGPEVVAYLGGISAEALYRRLKKNPHLPQGIERSQRRRDFSLKDIHDLQDAFGIRPRRKPGQKGIVIDIANLKGGVSKTTTTAHLAQYLCLLGYRVAVLDTDAQASLTQLFGLLPHLEVEARETIRPIMEGPWMNDAPYWEWNGLVDTLTKAARSYLNHQQLGGSAEGALKALGDSLLKVEEYQAQYGPDAAKEPNPDYRGDLLEYVQPTHWDGLDLIPANLGVYGSEFAVANRIAREGGYAFYRSLSDQMERMRDIYDVILEDTSPSLSFVNSNAMFAADALLITLPPAPLDVASVALFFEAQADVLATINRVEDRPKEFKFGAILLTKFVETNKNQQDIANWVRTYFPNETLNSAMVHTGVMEKLGAKLLTLYEAEPSDYEGDRRTFDRALDSMNKVNTELLGFVQRAFDSPHVGTQLQALQALST